MAQSTLTQLQRRTQAKWVRVPTHVDRGRLVVRVAVNHHDAGEWLLDTGNVATVLRRDLCPGVGLEARALVRQDNLVTLYGEQAVDVYRADISVESLTATVDLNVTSKEDDPHPRGRACIGYLGADFLMKWRTVILDLGEGAVYIDPTPAAGKG